MPVNRRKRNIAVHISAADPPCQNSNPPESSKEVSVGFTPTSANMENYSDFGHYLNSFAKTLHSIEAIHHSFRELIKLLGEESKIAEEVQYLVVATRNALDNITQQFDYFVDNQDFTHDILIEVNKKTKKISEFISLICRMANQTTRLANQSAQKLHDIHPPTAPIIEITQKIKSLAGETTYHTHIITQHIEDIKKSVLAAEKQTSQTTEEARHYEQEVQMLCSLIRALMNRSQKIISTTAHITHISFIETLKFDHAVFKLEIYKTLSGIAHCQSNELHNAFNCRLGRWYYEGEHTGYWKNYPLYPHLEAPHLALHKFARAALTAHENQDLIRLRQALVEMEKSSAEINRILDSFKLSPFLDMELRSQ